MKYSRCSDETEKGELMDKNYTETLADFATKVSFDDLPHEVCHATKRLILDTVGCAIGGYSTDIGKIVIDLKRELGGKPESTILVTGDKTSCTSAAFVNAELANALDADETFRWMSHHANCVVLPALAVAERVSASGRELITSVAVGFEVATRIGLALRSMYTIEGAEGKVHFSPVAGLSWAIFGSVIAAGKLLKLDKTKMAHGMGIAGYTAPISVAGKWSPLPSPKPMTKYAPYGSIAESGVTAALLAEKGFTGDCTVLDGDRGFWRMTGVNSCDWKTLTKHLGQSWAVTETSYKPYPCCRHIHIPLDLFYKIVKEHQLHPEEIDRVNVRVFSGAIRQRMGEMVLVNNEVDAQFSIPYIFGVAALGLRPSPEWHSPGMRSDARVIQFAQKVNVEVDSSADEAMVQQLKRGAPIIRLPASVEVIAKGKTYRARAEYAKGDPSPAEFAMTDEELSEKFRNFSYRLLPSSHIEEAIDAILNLDSLDCIAQVMACLR